ncbi:hypothetical protein TUMSATVNIG1_58920 (plasmid) [Vibrio nigripulchritudo]|uniref:hypothetical protein n=1 Tax=Vibrio nigripulchritudo TaxID=28173 RepID=UPI00190A6213|nr:hypothetical protein [Vibrio nigripulchritudo]BCL73907.1 hypothetical protein VNTUMSATTG_58440 [Vibrio nigripulchritudo]BDU35283.1 hypothetical protein TUMSATVNIG1_58920 [Vibrio nigripulchritudo]
MGFGKGGKSVTEADNTGVEANSITIAPGIVSGTGTLRREYNHHITPYVYTILGLSIEVDANSIYAIA